MNESDWLTTILGLGSPAEKLTFLQISLRAVIVFLTALILVRLGDRRFISNKTIFDAVLGFILASVLSRAVNGTAAFFPTLGGAAVLIFLHKGLARLSRRWDWLGDLIKGKPDQVISEGIIDRHAMDRHDISHKDLREDLRLNGNVGNEAEVKLAYVERNGHISVVKK